MEPVGLSGPRGTRWEKTRSKPPSQRCPGPGHGGGSLEAGSPECRGHHRQEGTSKGTELGDSTEGQHSVTLGLTCLPLAEVSSAPRVTEPWASAVRHPLLTWRWDRSQPNQRTSPS